MADTKHSLDCRMAFGDAVFNVGDYVQSEEHPRSVGSIDRQTQSGELVIEWVTPISADLPYGHIIRELWAPEDFKLLRKSQ